MNSLKFFFFIHLLFIIITFCTSYKFYCEYKYLRKRCYLLLAVTEPDFTSRFLFGLPQNLQLTTTLNVQREKHTCVHFLYDTNGYLKKNLNNKLLKMYKYLFDFHGYKLSGIYLVKNQNVLKNYNKKNEVDHYGRKLYPCKQKSVCKSWFCRKYA